jgi:RimJ/RimL family protein N-acetyltransferase
MRVEKLYDKARIEAFARRNPYRHLYELGDLDDFFWDQTVWYAAMGDSGEIHQLVLLYEDQTLPTLLAISEHSPGTMSQLLQAIVPNLPGRLYGHLSTEAVSALVQHYHVQPHGIHHKMGLVDRSLLATIETSDVVTLSTADLDDLSTLYRVSYPGNWFVPRMLETGLYQGIRREGRLVSVAGVHVYSPRYRVAALGNITTHPDWRGRGLGTRASAKLCKTLTNAGIEHIGLNVRADNVAALSCYERLGFRWAADYGESLLERRLAPQVVQAPG